MLRFKVGDKYLTTDQINKLLVYTGSEELDPVKLASTLNVADDAADDVMVQVGSQFSKVAKRQKAQLSERNFNQSSEVVQNMLDLIRGDMKGRPLASQQIKSLDDVFLHINNSFESMLKTIGLQDEYTYALLEGATDEAARASIYRQRSGIRLVTEHLTETTEPNMLKNLIASGGAYDDATADGIVAQVKKIMTTTANEKIKAIRTGTGNVKFTFDDFTAAITASTDLDEGAKKIVVESMSSLKKMMDGSQFVTDFVGEVEAKTLQKSIYQMQKNIDRINDAKKTGPLSSEQEAQLKRLKANLGEFKKRFSNVADSPALDDAGNIVENISIRELDNQTARIFFKRRTSKISSGYYF